MRSGTFSVTGNGPYAAKDGTTGLFYSLDVSYDPSTPLSQRPKAEDDTITTMLGTGNAAPLIDIMGTTKNLSITGTGGNDQINLTQKRSPGNTSMSQSWSAPATTAVIGGLLTISMGDGDDLLGPANLVNGDRVDMGAGDDIIYFYLGTNGSNTTCGSYCFQTLDDLNMAQLEGGSGEDTLNFYFADSVSSELTLSTGGAVNFENLIGTTGGDVIRGDDNNNYLYGSSYKFVSREGFSCFSNVTPSGNDTIYGESGNDILLASDFNGILYSNTPGYFDLVERADEVRSASNCLNVLGQDWLITPTTSFESIVVPYLASFFGTYNVTLYGGPGIDVLVGAEGEDTLDGGTGKDHLIGGAGIDTFVIRSGDGSTDINNADIVYDFTDGTDVIGLSELTFDGITTSQGSGDFINDVIIKRNNEFLLIMKNIEKSNVTSLDFSPL